MTFDDIGQMPDDIDTIAHELLTRACRIGLTIATAESCTGGLIGAILTDIEGTSHAFERGFIVYSDEAKVGMLGVAQATIDRHGAVSKAVAVAMAQGILVHSPADIALSVTGFAGAAGAEGEPGLVHFGSARRNHRIVHCERRFGDVGRSAVRIAAVRVGLRLMIEAVG